MSEELRIGPDTTENPSLDSPADLFGQGNNNSWLNIDENRSNAIEGPSSDNSAELLRQESGLDINRARVAAVGITTLLYNMVKAKKEKIRDLEQRRESLKDTAEMMPGLKPLLEGTEEWIEVLNKELKETEESLKVAIALRDSFMVQARKETEGQDDSMGATSTTPNQWGY